jgi:hypothetical protein
MAKKKVNKWYSAGEPLGWHSKDPMEKRRRAALRSRKGDALEVFHALDGLAKVNKTKNPTVAAKARADANYFRKLHDKTGK